MLNIGVKNVTPSRKSQRTKLYIEKCRYTVKHRKAIRRHCKGTLKRSILTSGGEQMLNIIPESDIYRLIIKSKLPQ